LTGHVCDVDAIVPVALGRDAEFGVQLELRELPSVELRIVGEG
jgi:hypothetical protein